MDPIAGINLAFRIINAIYHLRLELRNSIVLLTDIKSNITNLQTFIREFQRQAKSRVLSQQNYSSLGTSYEIYDQNVLEIQNLLSIHIKGHGVRLIDSLVFHLGPRAELMNKIMALESSMRYLMRQYERIFRYKPPLTMMGPVSLGRGESQSADGPLTGQRLLGEISDTLSSAFQLSSVEQLE